MTIVASLLGLAKMVDYGIHQPALYTYDALLPILDIWDWPEPGPF